MKRSRAWATVMAFVRFRRRRRTVCRHRRWRRGQSKIEEKAENDQAVSGDVANDSFGCDLPPGPMSRKDVLVSDLALPALR